MEENKKGNKKNLLIILVVLIVLIVGVVLYFLLNKKEEVKPVNTEVVKEKYEYDKIKVDYLNTKINKLDFSNKTKDKVSKDGFVVLSIEIIAKQIKVTIELNENVYINRYYTIDNIKNPISVGVEMNVHENGFLVAYILDSEGQVYQIVDNISNARNDTKYVGTAVKMKVNTAEAICVPHESISLQDNPLSVNPRVYIKTRDGKILTDEVLSSEYTGVIEVVSSGLEAEEEKEEEGEKYEETSKFTTDGIYDHLSFILDNTIQQHPVKNIFDIKSALSYNDDILMTERYRLEFAYQYGIYKNYVKPIGEKVTREKDFYWISKEDLNNIYVKIYDQKPYYNSKNYIEDGYYKSHIFSEYTENDEYRFIETSNTEEKGINKSKADIYDTISSCINEGNNTEEYCQLNSKKIGRIEVEYVMKDTDYIFKSISLFEN